MTPTEGGSCASAYAGMVLLFLALLTFQKTELAAAASDRWVDLDELRVSLVQCSLAEDLDRLDAAARQASLPTEPAHEPDDEPPGEQDGDEKALGVLAELFETSLLSSPTFDLPPGGGPAARQLERLVVRDRIHRRYSEAAPAGALIEAHPSGSRASGLEVTERAGLELMEDAPSRRGPRTALGRAFAEQQRAELIAQRPALWHDVKAKLRAQSASLAAHLRSRASANEFAAALLGEAIGGVVADTVPRSGSPDPDSVGGLGPRSLRYSSPHSFGYSPPRLEWLEGLGDEVQPVAAGDSGGPVPAWAPRHRDGARRSHGTASSWRVRAARGHRSARSMEKSRNPRLKWGRRLDRGAVMATPPATHGPPALCLSPSRAAGGAACWVSPCSGACSSGVWRGGSTVSSTCTLWMVRRF